MDDEKALKAAEDAARQAIPEDRRRWASCYIPIEAYQHLGRALLAERERAEKAERAVEEAKEWSAPPEGYGEALAEMAVVRDDALRERDALAREVRAARRLLTVPSGWKPTRPPDVAEQEYDNARAANEAAGWPSGGEE